MIKKIILFIEYNYSLPTEEKIFGGQNVNTGLKNYIESIRHNNFHFCTEFLITKKAILTAAQCLKVFLVDEKIPNFSKYTVKICNLDKENRSSHDVERVEIIDEYNFNSPSPGYDVMM